MLCIQACDLYIGSYIEQKLVLQGLHIYLHVGLSHIYLYLVFINKIAKLSG